MKGLRSRVMTVSITLALLITGCTQPTKDKDIKADVTVKAKKEIVFAGVHYTVANGVVRLWGLCPSQRAKDKAEAMVRKIAGVKDVVNTIAIGPVVIDYDPLLKQSVDSVLKKYSLAVAQVRNGDVVLTGQIKRKELPKILEALKKLPINNIDNQLTVQ